METSGSSGGIFMKKVPSLPLNFQSNNEIATQLLGRRSPGQLSRKSFKFLATKSLQRRAVFKNGNCNVEQTRTSKLSLRYLQDFINTLIDCQWRWTIIAFVIAFFGSWLAFTFIWLLIALTHGDLEEEHLPINQKKNNWTPCITAIEGFTSAFLFSVETQHTTGYGVKVMTDECPEAIFLMCVQSIVGLIIQAVMVGIVFAKMSRPKLRTQTIQFSKNAVICQRDGYLCLMFRLGDMRKSHIIGASMKAHLIYNKQTREGEILTNYQTEINVKADDCDSNLLLIWPLTIIHRIDEQSPFYYVSASDLLQNKFEVAVVLEGTMENTGQTTQARSSYLSSEILWGHKFDNVVTYDKDSQCYKVDNSKFNATMPLDTPICSAAELHGLFIQHVSGKGSPNRSTNTTPT